MQIQAANVRIGLNLADVGAGYVANFRPVRKLNSASVQGLGPQSFEPSNPLLLGEYYLCVMSVDSIFTPTLAPSDLNYLAFLQFASTEPQNLVWQPVNNIDVSIARPYISMLIEGNTFFAFNNSEVGYSTYLYLTRKYGGEELTFPSLLENESAVPTGAGALVSIRFINDAGTSRYICENQLINA